MWNTYNGDPARKVTRKEPCVRGHVSRPVNKLAGTAYSNYIQGWRLIDEDKFYVRVLDFFDKVRTGSHNGDGLVVFS